MTFDRRDIALLALLLVTVMAGASAHWINPARESVHEFERSSVAVVSNDEDVGIGTLRQAIFDANLVRGRARIQFKSHHVTVRSPLPPLVNPAGIVIDGGGTTAIDADFLKDAPLFEVSGPRVAFVGLKLHGIHGTAILIQRGAVAVTGVEISNSQVGILLGGPARELMVESSTFEGNGTGILILADSRVTVLGSRFRQHLSAGIWAALSRSSDAGKSSLVIRHNVFEDDRIGVGLINAESQVLENSFESCREVSLFVSGRAGEIKGNRLRSSPIGIQAEETRGLLIEANEIDHNSAIGVLLRSSSRAVVRANRMHGNGYGLAVILGALESPGLVVDNVLLGQKVDGLFVLGGSPSLRDNQVVGSGAAALRILDYVPSEGRTILSNPRLERNRLIGNLIDQPIRGRYLVPPEKAPHS